MLLHDELNEQYEHIPENWGCRVCHYCNRFQHAAGKPRSKTLICTSLKAVNKMTSEYHLIYRYGPEVLGECEHELLLSLLENFGQESHLPKKMHTISI